MSEIMDWSEVIKECVTNLAKELHLQPCNHWRKPSMIEVGIYLHAHGLPCADNGCVRGRAYNVAKQVQRSLRKLYDIDTGGYAVVSQVPTGPYYRIKNGKYLTSGSTPWDVVPMALLVDAYKYRSKPKNGGKQFLIPIGELRQKRKAKQESFSNGIGMYNIDKNSILKDSNSIDSEQSKKKMAVIVNVSTKIGMNMSIKAIGQGRECHEMTSFPAFDYISSTEDKNAPEGTYNKNLPADWYDLIELENASKFILNRISNQRLVAKWKGILGKVQKKIKEFEQPRRHPSIARASA